MLKINKAQNEKFYYVSFQFIIFEILVLELRNKLHNVEKVFSPSWFFIDTPIFV